MKTTIMVIDDHKILREGLTKLLNDHGGFEVVGEAADGREGVRLARQLNPDVVIMDVAMSEMNGIEATRQLVSANPRVCVLGLSMHSDSRFVKQMLEAGALGYMFKGDAFSEVLVALKAITARRVYVSPHASENLLLDLVQGNASSDSEEVQLSPREKQNLQLIAEGKSTREIADRLHVSTKTVESHRKKIMDKLGIRSIAELTKYAIRAGITSIDD